MNADDTAFIGASNSFVSANIYAYCENNAVMMSDQSGYWAEKYQGFDWTDYGFSVDPALCFLSRSFCIKYANDIIKMKGKKYFWGKGYKNMSALRIAQELWAHALLYYFFKPIQSVLKKMGVSNRIINDIVDRCSYMEINYNDERAVLYAFMWNGATMLKCYLGIVVGYRIPYVYIIL